MNDVRFDLSKGEGGIAYIVDSSDEGRSTSRIRKIIRSR
jgi:hypothetical protein